MKKLMIAAVVVAMAAASQAAAFKWTGTAKGVTLSALDGNGEVAAGGASLYNNSALKYTLTIWSADGQTQLDKITDGTVVFSALGALNTTGSLSGTYVAGTTYKYEIVITGTEGDLNNYVDPKNEWDYSAATIGQTLSGTFTGKSSTQLISAGVSTWDVAGAVAIPEPTSGLLLLLGVAGLALRRRRA